MKKIVILLLCLNVSSAWAIRGTKKVFGLGAKVGSATALDLKYFMEKEIAVELAISFSKSKLDIHTDYLLHKYDLIKIGKQKLSVHYGPGLRLLDNKHGKDEFGIKANAGVDYYFKDFKSFPMDLFLDLSPTLNIVSETELDVMAFIGGRFYF